ncbi:hypothetical protein U2086_14855, partial [Listeria monocytogenes]|uniref:hypothetical protein n=1 Tax=Listeria monocytogenes TaxID=1639 RepID=UPI002FDBAD4D
LDFNAVEWSAALNKWVAIATNYQFFNYDGTRKGFCETTSLWTADDLAGPWTVSPIDGQPIPHTYFSGHRSAENPAVIVTSFN